MKYTLSFSLMKLVFQGSLKQAGCSSSVKKKVHRCYRDILRRAKDIGRKNRLLGSYTMAAYFIAMNRCDGLSAEENYTCLEYTLSHSRLYRLAMGNASQYFSEKNMQSRRRWSKETHRHIYANDWVVNVLEKTSDYEFGLDYLECGVCKLCQDEGCPNLASYLCRLDNMTTALMGVQLKRTCTLADGGTHCDFRFSR